MALQIIYQDDQFQGYIETEISDTRYCQKYNEEHQRRQQKLFHGRQGQIIFPLIGIQTREGRKKADIHLYRHLDAPRDMLDDILLSSGSYEVHTEKSRIYTFEIATERLAFQMYQMLLSHFNREGGENIKKLEFEVVTQLHLVPKDYSLRPIITSIASY